MRGDALSKVLSQRPHLSRSIETKEFSLKYFFFSLLLKLENAFYAASIKKGESQMTFST